MDEQTVELLQQVGAALRWARFGGAEQVALTSAQQASIGAEPSRPASRSSTSKPAPVAQRSSQSLPLRQRLRPVVSSSPQDLHSAAAATAQGGAAPRVLAYSSGDPGGPLTLLCAGQWGDGPGACWSGEQGQLLSRMVSAMKLNPETVHAVTLVETPEGEEVASTDRPPPLSEQLANSASKILLVLGEQAAHWLLRSSQPIDTLRGSWRTLGGRPTMITYGPGILLQMPMFKAMAWKDMQDVMAKLAS